MVRLSHFDIDLLRSFALGLELGSFTRAAARIGRSPSAVSLQLRKLEEQAGQTLVVKRGRGLVTTEAGEIMLAYARRILALNDEAWAAMHVREKLEGWVRIGVPHDFADTWLPQLLGKFARIHPKVRIEARVDSGADMVEAIDAGRLDLALTWGTLGRPDAEIAARREIVWIGQQGYRRRSDEPVSLVAFDAPCAFRQAALSALEAEGLGWVHSFSSPSLTGLWAAISAGLGVTPRIADNLPAHLTILDPTTAGLPQLGHIELALHVAEKRLAAPGEELKRLLLEAIEAPAKVA
jgi:DNA-binding transcriptional LysR family regulator